MVDNSVLFTTLDDDLQDQLRTIKAKGWKNTKFRGMFVVGSSLFVMRDFPD